MLKMVRLGQRPGVEYITDPETLRRYAVPAGGSGDPPPPDEEDEEEESEDEESSEDENEQGGSGGSGGGTVSREEFERVVSRMKAADRRATDAEKKVKEFEDKDKSETQRLQEEKDTAESRVEELAAENTDLKVRLAVATSKEASKFYDISDAILRLKVSDLTNEDGDVDDKKVSKALKGLGEDHPHLVRSDEGDENGKAPSGRQMHGKKKDKSGPDRAELARKYPALRR